MNTTLNAKKGGPQKLKIVMVDDSPIITQRMKSMLADMTNIEVGGSATSAAGALSLIHRIRPDVAVLDIHLENQESRFNGIDLLIALRKQYPDMKIIMLTNLIHEQYRSRCFAFGADYFFDKTNEFFRIPEALEEIAAKRK